MSDWSGQLGTIANAHGVWMRNAPSFENIPTFPEDLDLDFALATEITEVNTVNTLHPNRAPATNPPFRRQPPPKKQVSKRAVKRAQPEALYDEAPNPFDKTPTFDMGMMPAGPSETEVTEEISTGLRGRLIAASAHAPEPESEASVTLELLEDWMERIDDLDLSVGIELQKPPAPSSPAMIELDPLPNRTPAPALVARSSLARRAPPPGRAPEPPSQVGYVDPRSRPSSARPPRISGTPQPAPHSRLQQAGWWMAGAMSGMLGASLITLMSFTIVLLA